MNLLGVMQVMNKVYDEDDTLAQYYDPKDGLPYRVKADFSLLTKDVPDYPAHWIAIPDGEDPLAAFVVSEAREVSVGMFDNVDIDQIIEALQMAQRQLQDVIDGLEEDFE